MINKIKQKISFAVIFLFLSALLTAQTVSVKIVETSDVHGAIFPFDFVNNKDAETSLSQVQTYLNIERAKADQHLLLFDNGDILQGTPAVYYYNFEKTDVPHLYAEVMNFMEYDVATIGNHDIEPGHPVYDRFRKDINFPWLAANAIDTETGEPYFQPYEIFEVEGVKIAVLGMITPAIPKWLPPKIWSGLEFDDMIESAEKWVPVIEEKENPDLLIGLFHSGVEAGYGGQNEDTYKNENAAALVAEQVPGFDIVFVGHDHQGWNKTVTNSAGETVHILGPRANARELAVAEITFSYDAANEKWNEDITGELVEVKEYKPDPKFLEKFNDSFEVINEYVSRPIGEFTETVSAQNSIFGPSKFVDLIQTIQLELTDADVSFTAPLSMRADINEGTVSVRDMFKLYRYENLLYTYSLTGQEIKDYLEYSYSLWFNTMKNEDDNLLNFERDENGNLKLSGRTNAPLLAARYYNFDSAAGIEYTVDVSKTAGSRVEILSMSDGSEFDLTKDYTVAINSYRGSGGGGHLTEGAKILKEKLNDRLLDSTEKDLRYYMMKWIEEKGTVTPALLNNWKVLPEDWWQKAKERDSKLMFGEN